ncbi:PAS domain S-box protein [Leptothermofonsia sp. ETS-13]|uniref:PAS domain S-box protein n=1 Tax=Leptothermofonsia sp. ETS-13 TaxID=3035696 RepID=UPI003B9E8B27
MLFVLPPFASVPFTDGANYSILLEIIVVVGLTGYLSFRNGQQSVNKIARQFIQEVSNRTHEQLDDYLQVPPQIAFMIADAVELGMLNLSNLHDIERYFWKQQERYPEINSIALVSSTGEFVGAQRVANQAVIEVLEENQSRQPHHDKTDNISNFIRAQTNLRAPTTYELTTTTWYTNAVQTGKPAWNVIEVRSQDEGSGISFSKPIYDPHQKLMGVLSIEDNLSRMHHFLSQINFSSTGRIFIIERSGLMVASSSDQPSYGVIQGNIQRLKASRSDDRLIAETAQYLLSEFGDLSDIKTEQQLQFDIENERQFVQVTPYADSFGLDWLLVVVIPQSSFMAEIRYNNRTTVLLCAGALLGAIALSWLTTQWIAKPILRLNRASRNLAIGKWDYPIEEDSPIAELEVLARSFNQMAEYLQESFDQVKTALQESEEKFTKFFHASPDPMEITTLDGRFLEVNDSFLKLFGYTKEEVIGRKQAEVKIWASPVARSAHIQLLQAKKQVLNQEQTFQTKTGKQVTTLFSSEILEIQGQSCVIGIAKDISDRKRLELALQHSEAQLKNVLNSAIASVTSARIFPNGDWEYEYWSDGCEAIFGYTSQEFMADKTLWYSRIPPDDLTRMWMALLKNFKNRQTFSEKYRFRHKDNSLRWISGYVTSRRDEALDCWIVTAVDVDITEYKQAEEALRQSEECFRGAFATSAVGMNIASLDGRFLQVNPAFCRMLGYSESEILGMKLDQVSYPDDARLDWSYTEQLLTGEIPCYHLKKRYFHKDGHILWALISVSLVRDSHQNPLYFIAHVQDITNRTNLFLPSCSTLPVKASGESKVRST